MFSRNQEIKSPVLEQHQISLFIKREDELHPHISGNKFRKLKYNLERAKVEGVSKLLTFGGAYSNHILATAVAAKEQGFEAIGVIRGDELQDTWQFNHTLKNAADHGMQFKFISREDYRNKNAPEFLNFLRAEFGECYLLPEGGTNNLAVKGCEEILSPEDTIFDAVCCSVGTGGTIAGIINSRNKKQQVLGFPALKGDFLKKEIKKYTFQNNWKLITDYHFGGYAKIDEELITFINNFAEAHNVPLDPIYTGKMMYGLFNLVKKGYFRPQTKILAIHTGGLQGVFGMNAILKTKNLPLLQL